MRSPPRLLRVVSLCLILLAALLVPLCLPGCAYVPKSQQVVIDAQSTNADAFDARVQKLPYPPSEADWNAVKDWIHYENLSWQSLAAWAHNKSPPAAATQP
jgi:hypothetical protein